MGYEVLVKGRNQELKVERRRVWLFGVQCFFLELEYFQGVCLQSNLKINIGEIGKNSFCSLIFFIYFLSQGVIGDVGICVLQQFLEVVILYKRLQGIIVGDFCRGLLFGVYCCFIFQRRFGILEIGFGQFVLILEVSCLQKVECFFELFYFQFQRRCQV